MKGILKGFILILLILLPIKISALSVDSDLVSVNKMGVDVEIGDVVLKNISFSAYSNYKNTRDKGYVVNASFISSYDKIVEVKVVLKLYDSAKNILNTYENNYSLEKDKITLYEIGERYSQVDSITYYSVYLEMITDVFEPKEEKILSNYYVDNYSSNIEVESNRSIKYDEKLSVNFERGSNYFNYYLPVKNIYVIKDLKINYDYVSGLEKGINIITIGSKNRRFFNKDNLFQINYRYDLGKDYNKKNDNIEFDIVNTYTNQIKKGEFNILLPKNEGIEKISYYLNGKETKIKYKLEGNKISGSYGLIKNNEVLSIKILFKEGYFTNTNSLIDIMLKIGLFLPITSLLITIIVFLLVRDKKIMSKKLDLNLITKYSSLEVGYLYNDKLDDKDIMSMLVSLANKGYIKIEKNEDGYVLTKIKDYEEENEFEKAFLEGIFVEDTVIKEEQLYYIDNTFIKEIKKEIEYKYKNKFYNNYFNKYLIIIITCYISLFFITYRPLVVYDHTNLILGVNLSLVLFTIIFIIVNSRFRLIERLIGYLCVMVFYAFLAYFVILPSLRISIIYGYIYFIGILCIAGCLVLYRIVPKRRKNSNKLLRNINRLKSDIDNNKKVDKDMLLQLLPYTYAIDSYDKYTVNNLCDEVEWYEIDNYVYEEFVSNIKALLANITYDLTHEDREGVNK